MKTKEVKRQEADLRNAEHRKLSLAEKRDKIASRPGNSTNELKKLARQE